MVGPLNTPALLAVVFVLHGDASGKEISHMDGLVQDCSNSSALAMELLQSSTKPSICVNV